MLKKKTLIEYLLTAVGTCIAASGIFFFLAPYDIATGGVTGFSMVISSTFNIPLSIVTLIINIILLLMGFLLVGPEFGGKTIFAIITLSLFMRIIEILFPNYTVVGNHQILLYLIAGVILFAVGVALVFNQNASTGGTDILAKIFNKYFNLSFGTALLVADALVVLLAAINFGLEKGMLGALGWYIKGLLINHFIDGFNVKKEVVIVTKETEKIKKYIFENIHRGVTIYKAEGGFTNEKKDVIVSIVEKAEFFKLKSELKQLDPTVFITVRTIHEVYGEGFEQF